MKRIIPVAAPVFAGNEKKYVLDCLKSTWISSTGKYIDRLEREFASFCGARYAVSCCNGTAALHLALMALGVGPGDEVIVPALTFVATANAVSYCGAKPVFVDSEPDTWNIDPALIEPKITPKTKGIIAVHLYGHPADMDPILTTARKHNLFVLEDAAEAHGAKYKKRMAGSMGNVSTFSFYGNKIVTTGEGGMVVTGDENLAEKIRVLKGQGMDPGRRYWFPIIGYNYRLTNIQAAVGVAQLERIRWHLRRRREVAAWYNEYLKDDERLTLPVEKEGSSHVYWMYNVILNDGIRKKRDEVMSLLRKRGVETRPFFYPIHKSPPYLPVNKKIFLPVAERVAAAGITLPTWSGLTKDEVKFISSTLSECLD